MTFFSSLFGSKTQNSDTITLLDPMDFYNAINTDKVQLVDVRTANEFAGGQIAYAQNIDFFKQEAFKTQFQKLDPSKPVYIYCRSGNRSGKAARQLIQMGFEKVFDLEGGITRYHRMF